MFKKRSFIAVLFLAFVLLSAYHAWNLIQINETAKRTVRAKLAPFLPGAFTLERVSVGIGNIKLVNVGFRDPAGRFRLSVRDIKIYLSLGKLFKTRFNFVKSVQRIEIRRPALVFSPGLFSKQAQAPPPAATPALPSTGNNRVDLSRFPIDSLVIKDGSIAMDRGPIPDLKFQKINGQIFLAEDRHLVHLSGNFLHPRKNVEIVGFSSREFNHFNFTVEINKASLKMLSSGLKDADIREGELDALFSFKKAEAESSRSQMSGTVSLEHLSFRQSNVLEGSDIGAELSVENLSASVDRFSGKLFGQPFSGAGKVEGFANPSFDLSLKMERADLEAPALKKLSGGRLKGVVALEGKLSGTALHPRFSGRFQAKEIMLDAQALTSPSGIFDIETERERASFREVKFGALGGKISGAGDFFLKARGDTGYAASFTAAGVDPFQGSASRKGRVFADVKGTAIGLRGEPRVAAKVELRLLDYPAALSPFRGTAALAGKNISLDFADREENLKVSGNISGLSKAAHGDFTVTCRRLSLPGAGPARKFSPSLRDIAASISGTASELSFKGSATAIGKLSAGKVEAQGKIKNVLENPSGNAAVDAPRFVVAGVEGPFHFDAHFSKEGADITNLSFARALQGALSVKTSGAIGGEFKIAQLNLSAYMNGDAEWVRALRPGGILDLRCALSGTAQAPACKLTGSVINGRLGHVDRLAGEVEAEWREGRLDVTKLSLDTPDQRLLTVQHLKIEKGGWTGSVKLERFPLRDLWAENPWVEGELYFEATRTEPGNAMVRAALDDFVFKNLRLAYFKAEAAEVGDVFKIREFSMGNENMSLSAEGFLGLPFSTPLLPSAADTVSVQVTAKGDFLKELTRHVPGLVGPGKFSSHTQGRGEARLQFLGTAKNLSIHRGHLDISRDKQAALEIKDIFPGKITQFKCFVDFEDGFAALDLSGKVEGGLLRVTNVKSYGKESPLTLPFLNLNFGILKVVTQSGGVSANIPTIIPPREYGEMELLGPDGKPGIIIGGPLKGPHLWGTMLVNNTRFTYPPLSNARSPKKTEFGDHALLKALHWDLTVQAGKNMKYFYHHRPESPLPFLDKMTQNKKVSGGIQRSLSQLFEYPFVELTLDKGSTFGVRGGGSGGRPLKLSGRITSSKGFVHPPLQPYYYDQDMDAGLEFDGNDNTPILWGSAARIERSGTGNSFGDKVTLTLYLKDPRTGVESTKGKFHEFRLVPSSNNPFTAPGEEGGTNPYQSMIGGDQSVTSIARSEGQAMFEKVFLERMVTGVLERKVLGLGRERLDPLLGFNATPDVFRVEIESDRFFNYIDLSLWNLEQLRRDFLESMQFVTGKYFLSGRLFLNYSSQMDLIRDAQGLDNYQFHHRVGFELTPWRFLYFNLDYDVPQAIGGVFTTDAVRSNVKLKMPLNTIFNAFKEKKEEKKP